MPYPRTRTELRRRNATVRCAQLSSRQSRLLLFCIVLAADSTHLAAQTTSIIQGTVTDPQGLAIAGAAITLSGPMLADEITATSDEIGSYRVPGLQPGI